MMNSSKEIFIFFDEKLMLLYGGFAVTITGAMLSFNPPLGLPFRAQLLASILMVIARKSTFKKCFNPFCFYAK